MKGSGRRFDVDTSLQPVYHFVASTVPFFILLLWFLYSTSRRSRVNCYINAEAVNDDASAAALDEECSQYVPLKQFVWIFMSLEFLWALMVGYLSYYIPRRHALVDQFLTEGETVIGDVHYKRRKFLGVLPGLSSYGNVIYRHPDDATTLLKRKVRVFERYTRERAAVVYLPGHPYSGQPKMDLEIDREVVEMNHRRRECLTWYSWVWFFFCLLAPVYIVETLEGLNVGNPSPWQPDTDIGKFPMFFYIVAFAVIPVVAVVWNIVASAIHHRWMTMQHRILEEGDSLEEPELIGGCCFDDDDCETIEIPSYQPPTAQSMSKKR